MATYCILRLQLLILIAITVNTVDGNRGEYGTVIGIDLGTSYSCVGAFVDGRVEIIPNDQGNRITPSSVAFTPEGIRLIGDSAINQLTANPYNTFFNFKRLMGRSWSDPDLQKDVKTFPFQVIQYDKKPHIVVSNEVEREMGIFETLVFNIKQLFVATKSGKRLRFTPQEISAMVLGKLKETAEIYLNVSVTHAVVTVPAHFNDAQRQATMDAGNIAGLTIMRVINAPSAAALAYGVKKRGAPQNVLVYDLGGVTFDVSVVSVDNGAFQVLSTGGNTHLGGEDFVQNVVNYFIKLYAAKTGKDVSGSIRAVQKLKREMERAKRRVSTHHQCRIEIEDFFEGQSFGETLTRAKFEELNMNLFKSTFETVEEVLADADMTKMDIDDYILVGGSTRIPRIRKLVQLYFYGKDPAVDINPDEVVAYGATVQAGALAGYKESQDVLLIDINPFSLGRFKNEFFFSSKIEEIIPKNMLLPVRKSKIFSNKVASILVYEGDGAAVKDNHFLGRFDLKGILPASTEKPEIEVTFLVNENGILTVTAKDLEGKNSENHFVTKNDHSRLTSNEIKRMIKNQEQFAHEDKIIYKKQEAYCEFEKYLYTFKKNAVEIMTSGKLSYDEEMKLKKAINDAVEWADLHTLEEIFTYKWYRQDFDEIVSPIMKKRKSKKEEL